MTDEQGSKLKTNFIDSAACRSKETDYTDLSTVFDSALSERGQTAKLVNRECIAIQEKAQGPFRST